MNFLNAFLPFKTASQSVTFERHNFINLLEQLVSIR